MSSSRLSSPPAKEGGCRAHWYDVELVTNISDKEERMLFDKLYLRNLAACKVVNDILYSHEPVPNLDCINAVNNCIKPSSQSNSHHIYVVRLHICNCVSTLSSFGSSSKTHNSQVARAITVLSVEYINSLIPNGIFCFLLRRTPLKMFKRCCR